jgi:hypothetical protein
MRTYTTTHTVYTFDELNDAAKEKALEQMRTSEWEIGLESWLSDFMNESLAELLTKYKMKCDDAKVYYSLGYSQGDGAMFEGTVIWRHYEATIRHQGMYYHYNSKDIELLTKAGNGVSLQLQEQFNNIYVELCQELEKAGYAAIEAAMTDEALADTIRANEYEYYKDGRMA